jgi:AbrB family looped-hinge helix DNA binding protein
MNLSETQRRIGVSTTKVGPKHQITIPKDVFDKLHLTTGDVLEADVEGGKIVLVPKKLVEKAPMPKLSKREQVVLKRAQQKIEAIRKTPLASKGLTAEEADIASRAGLIDTDQRWWWTEEWQKGEREVEKDRKAGRTEIFPDVEGLIKNLRKV